jgi:hypothetical protein
MKNIALMLISACFTVNAKEIKPPSYLSNEMLDSYVNGLRQQLPMSSPDGTKILTVSRQGRTIIYGMNSLDSITQQVADSMFSASKIMLCRQEAEKFMLTRGVNLTWNYFSKNGKHLATTAITPADCGFK